MQILILKIKTVQEKKKCTPGKKAKHLEYYFKGISILPVKFFISKQKLKCFSMQGQCFPIISKKKMARNASLNPLPDDKF